MAENKVVDIILHCQKQIKKERLPEEKLLHYLGRLSRLRITVQDLADTGIGRTVNSLSRNEGQIGAAADTLVRRWKQMVAEAQTQSEQRRQSEEESDSNSGSSEDEEDEDEENPPEESHPYQIEEPQDQHVDPEEDQPYSSSAVDAPSAVPSPSPMIKRGGGYPQDEEDEDEDLNDDIDDPYMENGFMTMANVHSDPEIDDEEEDFDKGSDSDNSDRLEIDDDEDPHQPSPPPRSSSQIDVKPDIYSNSKREKMDIPSSSKDHKSSSKINNNIDHHKSQENGEKKHHNSSSSTTLSPLKSHHSSRSSSKDKHRHSSKDRSSKHVDQQHQRSSSSSSSHHHKSHSSSSSSSKPDKSKEPKSESHHHKEKDKQHDKHHHRSKESSSGGSSSHRDRDRSEKDSFGGVTVKSEKEQRGSSIPSKDKDTPIKIKSESSSDRDHHRSSTISGRSSSRDKDIKNKTRERDVIASSSSSSTSHSPKKSSLENSGNVKKEKESLSSSITHEDRKRKDHSVETSTTSSNKKSKLVLKEEIDSTSGINFADVLGCLDVPGTSTSKHASSSKKDKKVESSSSSADKEHHRKSHHHHHGSSSKSSSSSKHSSSGSSKDVGSSKDAGSSSSSKKHERDSRKAGLPQSKIESVIQPVVNISPNYKPMSSTIAKLATKPGSSYNGNGIAGLPPPSQLPMISHADLSDLGTVDYYDNPGGVTSDMSHEDAISTMLSCRPARSKVYSGVKTGRKGEVTSLYDQCMQVIKDNIGDLGYTGGIPYDILKPAIERANPQQLISIEQQNEYLIGETDELWAFHCKRDFRGRCPGETESWRELYERCSEDQKLKFERIKKQMKRNIAKAEPVRTTKLAYVETTLGPKFNRQKAQTIKNGMRTLKIKEEKGPSRGVSSSASAAFNNPKRSGDAASVVYQEADCIIAQGSRAGHAPAPSQSREARGEAAAAKMKPRRAPLMQKTMKLMKTLQRR